MKRSILIMLGIVVLALVLVSGLIPVFGQERAEQLQQYFPEATIDKRVDKAEAFVGEELQYTIGFTLTEATTTCVDIRFTDPIPASTEFVTGSANGAILSGTMVYTDVTLCPTGMVPGSLPYHWVSFMVRIVDFPSGGNIVNTAHIVDLADPGSMPDAQDAATTQVYLHVFLPLVFKVYDF